MSGAVLTPPTREELEAENARLRAALTRREDELRLVVAAQGNASTDGLLGALEPGRSALAHSEARFRAIFDSVGDSAIVVIDEAGVIIEWNPGAERTMGWTAAEARGQTVEIVFTPDDRAHGQAEHEMRLALEQGRALDERWHLRKDGRRFWASGEMMPLRDGAEAHIGFVKILRDRTEQREAEAQQQADAAFMRSVLASSADCIKVMDLDAKLTFMNEGGLRVMEISDFNDVKGCFWPSFWAGQGNSAALAAFDQARAGGVGHFQGSADTYRGTPKWWDVQVTPIRRPDGTPDKLLAVSRDISDLKAAQGQLADSEAYWRGLFQQLSEGFIVGEVIRDADRRIADWRYIDVNAAWGRLVGVDPAWVVGRTIREVFPGIEDAWVEEFAAVVDTGNPLMFTRQVGTLDRWYEGRAFALGNDRFGVIFLEITERVATEMRREALFALGESLRESGDVQSLIDAGTAAIGQVLRVGRVGYGNVAPDGETFTVEKDWSQPGFPSLAGRYRMEDYGAYAEDLRQGRIVVIPEVREDPRTKASAATLERVAVRSLMNLPVSERGRIVAVLYVNDDKPRVWQDADVSFAWQVAELVRLATERRRAEDQQRLLNHELSHRLKNSFAMVQAIATQTLRGVTERDAVNAFNERLIALSKAHDLLLQESWTAAPIGTVIEATLALHAEADRIVVEGSPLSLGPRAVLSLSLLLHELATNALKYGALSVPGGKVLLTWSVAGQDAQAEVVLSWTEQGGPPTLEPSHRGFGSRLIRTGLVGTGQSDLRYGPTGLHAEFRAALSAVTEH